MRWWIGREPTVGAVVGHQRLGRWRPTRRGLGLLLGALAIFGLAMTPPLASAQSSPNALRDMLGTITKGASDALQTGVDKALGNPAGTQSQPNVPVQSPPSQAPSSWPAVLAQSSTPGESDRKPATQAQIDAEVAQFHRNCTTSNTYLRSLHDCECLTREERNALETSRSTQPNTQQKDEMAQSCPAAKQVTYDWVFKSCDDYYQHMRSDHLQFCGCTAERFSTSFGAQPNSNLRAVEALRKKSMEACR